MALSFPHAEIHRASRVQWLRAGVLGANDGMLSVASLVVGVAAADNRRSAVLIAGLASLAAGSFSMAVGEYSSVSSQRDTELADLARERRELATDPDRELRELAGIYRGRGLSAELASRVAAELTAGDALEAHARDELGFGTDALARPVQASLVSASSFVLGAILPLLVAAILPDSWRIAVTVAVTLCALAGLGVLGAQLGGAPKLRAAARITIGGACAMAITSLIGAATGAVVG
jgi:vacuolar iron transporter family protein